MSLNFRFAIASDLHIGLSHTIPDNSLRFHRIEISIANYEYVIDQLRQLDLDFLLIPGDLTQNGEPDNHQWLSAALAQLPFPVYVIPGNHDAWRQERTETSIGIADFPPYYQKFGYQNPEKLYYTCTPLPGLRLIGLNSVFFKPNGAQLYTGRLDQPQLDWLRQILAESEGDRVFVMVHHNVLEHLPNQSKIKLGQRYMLENAPELVKILHDYGVQLVFTGHLHVQDVACQTLLRPTPCQGDMNEACSENVGDLRAGMQDVEQRQVKPLYDICTGSLVSYPHPYRILHYRETDDGNAHLTLESRRIPTAPGWPDLQNQSREFMSDRAPQFIRRLLTSPPLNLSEEDAEPLLPDLRYFWSAIADGDAQLNYSHLPKPVQTYFEAFNAEQGWDNDAVLDL